MNLKNISIISLRVLAPTHQPLIGFVILFFAYLTNISATKLHAQTTIANGTSATSTAFTFTLDGPCKTSAGVYTTNGTLVRTLWSKIRYYAAGTYTTNWNGLDDNGNPVASGTYQIKLLEHNTEYVWDGAIGNTSTAISGPTVHHGFYPIHAMAISGTNAFYSSGYDEGHYAFRSFVTTSPQQVVANWGPGGVVGNPQDASWNYCAADSNWVYFAAPATLYPESTSSNYLGCITAFSVTNNAPVSFSMGINITNGTYNPVFSGVYVGTQPGLSGLSVQQNGNLLAVSVAWRANSHVYLLNKSSGSVITSIKVPSPRNLDFSQDGSLWLISGKNVICYTNINSTPAAALTIPNFSEPLAVAVSPTNSNLILVADGGGSQQVKAFNKSGTLLWTYGQAGGYPVNGVAVTTNKFWFNDDGAGDETFIAFAPDGTFWIGYGQNNRSLHFSISNSCNYLEQIMYLPASYIMSVDQNNPSRVFNQFLEFNVDYTKPLAQGWTLVNNWRGNVPASNIAPSSQEGIYEVTTFTNGHTYALVNNYGIQFSPSELCELTANQQLRITGIYPLYDSPARGWISFGPDGSARSTIIGSADWYESTLSGFDANDNPVWNPETLIASAPEGSSDPVPRCCSFGNVRTAISTNNILISFDQSLNNGYHLGGIRVGSTNWLWEASPAGNLNGAGNYEISNGVTYAGNTLQVVDRHIIYGYHGEFFRGQGQAGQHMHFLDDGLFVGQFGEASPGHSAYEGAFPAFAGNGHCPNLVKTATGDYYLWDNDESAHGPQRWHLVNARNIREQSGVGALGGTITLAQPVVNFPTGVTGQAGSNSVELEWLPVPNATSYNIYYSLINGGPYQTLAGRTATTNCFIDGLSNGLTYYFAVTAVVGGDEGMPSEQVPATPFDTSQSVLCSGSMTEGGQDSPTIDIYTNAVATGLPAWLGAEHLTGVLNPRELDDYGYGNLQEESIGTEGFVLYDWGGIGANVIDLSKNVSVGSGSGLLPVLSTIVSIVSGSGWGDMNYLERQYSVNTLLGTNYGMAAAPLGFINISVTDNNFHYLTVISPAKFNDARNFNMTLTSTNGSSASYSANENPGLSHVFQFLFKGNVTLTGNATGGAGAFVQALFLDRAPSISLTNPLSPPSDSCESLRDG